MFNRFGHMNKTVRLLLSTIAGTLIIGLFTGQWLQGAIFCFTQSAIIVFLVKKSNHSM